MLIGTKVTSCCNLDEYVDRLHCDDTVKRKREKDKLALHCWYFHDSHFTNEDTVHYQYNPASATEYWISTDATVTTDYLHIAPDDDGAIYMPA